MTQEQQAAHNTPEHTQAARVLPYAPTAVQLGAVALLGGGFYYGVARQHRVEQEEAAKRPPPSAKASARASAKAAQTPVITRATLLERQLGLHRPVPPKSAALKALVGGTVVSVSGCAVLLLAIGTALGVRNVTEFRERMEDVFPRMRRGLGRAFNVAPKTRTPQELAQDDAELRELAAIFDEPAAAVGPAAKRSAAK
ncbi:hypothetical protein PybrP1_006782 [[Pythium] brassicae (nom. inval.)]|nr:hypothetical protein PybrP1_006782 [[Pythium] brassicae (nom. inval.)]